MSGYDLGDYIDVKHRVELLYKKHPEASIQFEFMGVAEWNPEFIWGIAKVFRFQGDQHPATGTAAELKNGKTAFTRGSELMNLETSAVGRAIGNLGIGLGKSMASADEVRFAQQRQTPPPAAQASTPVDPWAWDGPTEIPTDVLAPESHQELWGNGGRVQGIKPMSDKQQGLIKQLVQGDLSIVDGWKRDNGITGGLDSKQASELITWLKTPQPFNVNEVLPE